MSAPVRRFEGLDRGTRGMRWLMMLMALGILALGLAADAVATVAEWLTNERERLPWYVTRISAILAYLALTASVVYGLLLSTGLTDRIAHRAISLTLHRDLGGIGLALAIVHIGVLMLDRTVPYEPAELIVPFIGPYRPLWVAFGQLALASSIVVLASTYLRSRLSKGTWLRVHRIAFAAWAAGSAHGLMSGTDASDPVVALMYVVSATVVTALLATRIVLALTARRSDTLTRWTSS